MGLPPHQQEQEQEQGARSKEQEQEQEQKQEQEQEQEQEQGVSPWVEGQRPETKLRQGRSKTRPLENEVARKRVRSGMNILQQNFQNTDP